MKSYIAIDNFNLDRNALLSLTHEKEAAFAPSSVYHPTGSTKVDHGSRRSEMLNDEAVLPFTEKIFHFIKSNRTDLIAGLSLANVEWTSATGILVRHGDGAFFRAHRDCTHGAFEWRQLTFVYYYYNEPKAFSGGELVLYENGTEQIITPKNGQLVLFSPRTLHEVRPIHVPSGRLEDSRFALTGWVRTKNTLPLRTKSFFIRKMHRAWNASPTRAIRKVYSAMKKSVRAH